MHAIVTPRSVEQSQVGALLSTQARHDKLVIKFIIREHFAFVRCTIGIDITCKVGRIPSPPTLSVIGMSARTETQVRQSLPVAPIVSRRTSGKCEVRYLVVLHASLGRKTAQQTIHGQGQLLIGLGYLIIIAHAREGSSVFVGQSVGAQMGYLQCERSPQVALPHRECLSRQAIDKVDADVLQSSLATCLDGTHRLLAVVPAVEHGEHCVVKRLYAHTDSVHRSASHGIKPCRRNIIGVCLYRHLGILGQRITHDHGLQNLLQEVGRQATRCAAPHV